MNISVICVGLLHSGNLGAIARLCHNFGIEELVLVNPECEVDDTAYERATNARRYLDDIQVVDSLRWVKDRYDLLVALSARTGGEKNLTRSSLPITQVPEILANREGSIAVIVGRENKGLSNEEVNQCDLLVHIQLPGHSQVLNVSHAIAVALWEITRKLQLSEEEESDAEHRLMTAAERNAFLDILRTILDVTWLDEEKYYGVLRVFQTFLARASVTRREANTLIGSLRSIQKALYNPDPPWRQKHESETP